MRIELLHLAGPCRGDCESFAGPVIRIGSGPDAEVSLPGARGVAAAHARIVIEGSDAYLRSSAPVRVNRAVVEEVVLSEGDLVELGD
ncbi:MAG: FHA domain-containing protein, partial [bacterium]